MADNNGLDSPAFFATDLGALAFGSNVTAPDTSTDFQIYDSVGSYSAVTRFRSIPGDDPADNFSFMPSGVGTVTISMDSLSSGTYADFLVITPLSGVTKIDGDLIGTFYGGVHSYSNTTFSGAAEGGAEAALDLIHGGLFGASVDISGVTWSDSGVVCGRVWNPTLSI